MQPPGFTPLVPEDGVYCEAYHDAPVPACWYDTLGDAALCDQHQQQTLTARATVYRQLEHRH